MLVRISSDERLRALGLSGLKRRRLKGDLTVPYSFLRREVEREVLSSSQPLSARTHGEWLKVASIRRDLDLI